MISDLKKVRICRIWPMESGIWYRGREGLLKRHEWPEDVIDELREVEIRGFNSPPPNGPFPADDFRVDSHRHIVLEHIRFIII